MNSRKRNGNRQARFWVWYGTGLVRIKINAGQRLECSYFRYNDEGGYHRDTDLYEFDGYEVRREWESDGRDCDGRLTHGGEQSFVYREYARGLILAHETDAEGREIDTPDWQKVCDHPVYDEYARAANY